MSNDISSLNLGLAQIAPVWLDRPQTMTKVKDYLQQAGEAGCELVIFGEALVPGYPIWIELMGDTEFDSPRQKALHSHYAQHAVQIERGDLDDVCGLARAHRMAVYLGCIERPQQRGGHSLYCSLVYIDAEGHIQSVHRKLQPTYEERLTWSPGDGHGLRVHGLKGFTVGGLNCWENWMPLSRTALYAQGENLHVAVWPGSDHNTRDITRFIARESRSYVASVGGLLRPSDFPADVPYREQMLAQASEFITNGGSCLAGPDGQWIIEPVVKEEQLITATIELPRVYEERQNFDPVGHYSRPDVTRLTVNRQRQGLVDFGEE